ncbi:hypothetical protein [Streptomyces sp. A0592]|uniref:hypothetical protein n=1 Tax=Streptomyces sp. A0592 TaxID=2563099 RepID=UPI00109E3A9E|nr:hypothetical protein [Streptomyces sp. A0592]THA86599.1 hypothetical protein E6U81_00380 [Streptomyces sp. A0592]
MTSLVQVYEKDFRERASRKQSVGVFLLIATGAIWLWVGYLLLVPFTLDDGRSGSGRECASRVFYDPGESGRKRSYADLEGARCAAERDVADSVAWLLLSLPLAAVGLHHCTVGTVGLQIARHESERTRLAASE